MEVRSEPGMVPGREPFGVGLQKNPPLSQPSSMQNMRLTFASDGTAIYKPVTPVSSPYQGGAATSAAAVAAATTATSTAATTATASSLSGGGEGGGGSAGATPDAQKGLGVGAGGGGGGAGGGGGGGSTGVTPEVPPRPYAPPGFNMNIGEPLKRKRGRPRKYGPDGTMALGLSPGSLSSPGSGGYSASPFGSATPASADGMSKPKPRPGGSGKKQKLAALGSIGIGFTPHVITVKAGEDVSSKIMSFSQCGPRAVCILSANGAISNVTLRQAATCGGTVTYEGRFEILSLSGSFLYSESGGQRSRTGGLSVSLAGPDGRVLGGGVAGILTAASPVQVVMGSFITDAPRESKPQPPPPSLSESAYGPSPPSGTAMPVSPPSSHGMQGVPFRSWHPGNDMRKEPKLPIISEPTYTSKIPPGSGMSASGSPRSHGTQSESSGEPDSPLDHSSGACNNPIQQGMSNLPWK